ncbi:hypothetical protein LZ31DRAFT_570238 [Colletotrichum somersetense]|nr:hypothetical protein LZ31DRAFT_570238 [Colletotrichum somersetense]
MGPNHEHSVEAISGFAAEVIKGCTIDARVHTPGATPANTTDTLYCTIDTSRAEVEEGNKPNAGTIRAAVEREMRADGHAGWRCQAVTVNPRNENLIRIVCRDDTKHQMVRQIAETRIAPGMRVRDDDLYPIKVDYMRWTAVWEEKGKYRSKAVKKFSKENDTTVAKVVWLSDQENPKAYRSMAVYLTKARDARRLISKGYFHAGGESGTTGVFKPQFQTQQCFKCQQIAPHKAVQCLNHLVCRRCAKEGHHHKEYRKTALKCVPCGGAHKSFSKKCPKLYLSIYK